MTGVWPYGSPSTLRRAEPHPIVYASCRNQQQLRAMSTNHDSGAVDTPLGDVQGFEGAYAGSRWTFQGGSGNGFVDKTKLPNSIELRKLWATGG